MHILGVIFVTVMYNTLVTASGDLNSELLNINLTIPRGTMIDQPICIDIGELVIQDNIIESSETFSIEAQGSNPPDIINATSNVVLVTVQDSDGETSLYLHITIECINVFNFSTSLGSSCSRCREGWISVSILHI